MENHKGMMKAFLYENLRDLMVKNVFEKITIKQICDQTGVIRATFYNYFEDKYDCLNAIVYHDLAEDLLKDDQVVDFTKSFEKVLETVDKNRDFYRSAYNVTGQNSFADMVHSNMTLVCRHTFDNCRKQGFMEQYSNEYLAGYYGDCLAYNIHEFVFRRDHSTPKEFAQLVTGLMKCSMTDFLKYDAGI